MTETDRPAKIARLRTLLDEQRAPAIALTRAESLSWLFDGARVTVPFGGPAVCAAVVHRDGAVQVFAPANEADRLRAEELGDDVDVRTVPWHRGMPDPEPGILREDAHLAALRAVRAALLPLERRRYERLGADLARAVGAVLRLAAPRDSELEVAARLAAAIVGIGAEPVVILVGGRARAGVPHPLPTDALLGPGAMAAVGARRQGLVASLTRWIAFDGARTPDALLDVEGDAFAATRPGRRLDAVLADIAVAYERHGLGAGAWLRHHQGGPTGYAGRDPKATPDVADVVQSGQAFAWNPWVPGAKLEDTVIVEDDGIRILTIDPDWPAVDVRGLPRPTTLHLDRRQTT